MICPRGLDLLEHGLEALLELAAVLRAGDHRAEVERDERLSLQRLGHVAGDDALREPSTIAVLPTPGSPMSTGLFLVRRESTCITRRISSSRPMTGSSLPLRAASVRSRVYFSSAWNLPSGSLLGVHLAETLVASDADALAASLLEVLGERFAVGELDRLTLLALGDEGRLAEAAQILVDAPSFLVVVARDQRRVDARRPQVRARSAPDLDPTGGCDLVEADVDREREDVRVTLLHVGTQLALDLLHLRASFSLPRSSSRARSSGSPQRRRVRRSGDRCARPPT
jgi:hypothetical protein